MARNWRAAYCRPACRQRALTETRRRAARCEVCQEPFTTTDSRRIYCGDECAERRHHRRPNRRGWVDQYTRLKILERDGWQCYLCDRPIDRELAYPHPLSKSVDHVIPVSAGGSGRPENLRAAHLVCNYAKGDALPGVEVWVPLEALAS